jgi:uncharacterized cupin superfamily protein
MMLSSLQRGVRLYAKVLYGLRRGVVVTRLPSLDALLTPQPVPSEWVEAGQPEASFQVLAGSPDGGLELGVWHCTEGTFQWHFECDEIVYVLSGEVAVEHAGERHTLTPGSLALFPVGASTRWSVKGHVRKLYVKRFPTPLARKLVGLG